MKLGATRATIGQDMGYRMKASADGILMLIADCRRKLDDHWCEVVSSSSGERKPCRGHQPVTWPNSVSTGPCHAICANLSTVAINMEGGRR